MTPSTSYTGGGHTPGPWEVRADVGVWASDGFVATTAPWRDRPVTDRQRADSALIAAAPTMLYALDAIAGLVSAGHPNDGLARIHQIARAAIAKAQGEAPR